MLLPKPEILVPIATRVVAGAPLGQFAARLKLQDGSFKWWKILRDSCFDDCPGCIEVVVRKPVAHAGRVRPLDIRLTRDERGIQQLDRLANLDQTYPNGVENESVRKVAGVTYQRYLCRPNNNDAPHILRSYSSGNVAPVRGVLTAAEVLPQERAEPNLPLVMSQNPRPNFRTLLNDRS